ncbi:DUF7666 domain-containing protein [Martelella alba]|uniref:DUF7666 domain-containing protein n=1 Tax=Martelella alba TaxID=2590451 RepID=UPI00403C30BC
MLIATHTRHRAGFFAQITGITMNDTVLVLRTCNSDMTSRNDFVWPESGLVECPDWEPTEECGNGLHGLL